MPLVIAGVAIAGLVGKVLFDEVDQTVNNTVPPLILFGALALAGYIIFRKVAK